MPYYILFYETTDGYVEKRQTYRDQHLRLAEEFRERGELVLAGAYDPADGAALIFRGPSEEPAERFARMDPYVQKGLVTKWWVRKWNVVVE